MPFKNNPTEIYHVFENYNSIFFNESNKRQGDCIDKRRQATVIGLKQAKS